ncbi:MAG: hypothetical protein ABIH67_02685 [Candidatus Uhrbacteria bacterium]
MTDTFSCQVDLQHNTLLASPAAAGPAMGISREKFQVTSFKYQGRNKDQGTS